MILGGYSAPMPADPTRAELEALLAEYRTAEQAVANGKSYSVDSMTFERQDLGYIVRQISKIRRELHDLDRIEAGGQAGVAIPVWN